MEKVLQRVKKAEQHLLRQVKKRKEIVEQGEAWSARYARQRHNRLRGNDIREERKNRRIDWEAGPLAPRRDVGDKLKTYATRSIYDVNPGKLDERDQKWSPFAKGDRVVIVKGHDKGKIGFLYEADEETGCVRVKDLEMVEIFVPEYARRQSQNDSERLQNPAYLPFDHVRLVYPLPDPETGVHRDVIIEQLEKIKITRTEEEKADDVRTDARVIPGTNTIIPWPQIPEEAEEEEFEIDTPRMTVDQITFRPYLLYAPMPSTVIDELRNKYSKFRTRHTYEYEQKKEVEAAREEKRLELANSMRTPLQELAELRARQKAAEGRELSDAQLAKIGEMMARRKQAPLAAES